MDKILEIRLGHLWWKKHVRVWVDWKNKRFFYSINSEDIPNHG